MCGLGGGTRAASPSAIDVECRNALSASGEEKSFSGIDIHTFYKVSATPSACQCWSIHFRTCCISARRTSRTESGSSGSENMRSR